MIDRIGAAVTHELARFGSGAGLAPLVDAWPSAVGPEIARNAWPARIGRDGTAYVHVSSAAWAFELGQLEPRIRSAFGELAPPRFRFVVGSLPEPTVTSEELHGAPARASPEQVAEGARLASVIADESLREVVAKTVALSLARAESDRSFW